MAKALALLEQAQRYLLASEAELALKKMQDFEEALLSGRLENGQVQAYAQGLQAVRDLAAAAREGIAAARRQIEEILALSRKLDTYDRQGNRIGNQVGQNRERRF
ncbi:hypothetical protein [Paracoccus aminovorans]|uniref:hypothetical protein n=1 Tax=Paracoccus aminovorans TaxID=34004 RepID=UPI002B25DA0B|nr:hypothetical protein [Paracoccus aminovorans]